MYIVYGPDELEVHPSTAQNPYGNEMWMYRHIEGIGDDVTVTFVDGTGHGDYRMAPGKAR